MEARERVLGFVSFVAMCADSKAFVEQFDRLNGTNLAMKGTNLDLLIDEACGRLSSDAEKFVSACFEIYGRM